MYAVWCNYFYSVCVMICMAHLKTAPANIVVDVAALWSLTVLLPNSCTGRVFFTTTVGSLALWLQLANKVLLFTYILSRTACDCQHAAVSQYVDTFLLQTGTEKTSMSQKGVKYFKKPVIDIFKVWLDCCVLQGKNVHSGQHLVATPLSSERQHLRHHSIEAPLLTQSV